MKRKEAVITLVLLSTFFAGVIFEKFSEYARYKKSIKKLQTKNIYLEKVNGYEDLVEQLSCKLKETTSRVNLLKVENERLTRKLKNIEGEYSKVLNSLLQGEYTLKPTILEKSQNESINYEPEISYDSPDKLKEKIESAFKQKDFLTAASLLKKLAKEGSEYYQFILNMIDRIQDIIKNEPFGPAQTISLKIKLLDVWESPEFADYYKWLLENEDIPYPTAFEAFVRLSHMVDKDIGAFLFEKLKTLKGKKNEGLRKHIVTLLIKSKQYESELVKMAKNFSEDKNIRRNIIILFANNQSPEVSAMYEYLRINEPDEEIKSIVNTIYNARVAGLKGYLVLFGNNILQQGDLIIKVNNVDVLPQDNELTPPYLEKDLPLVIEEKTLTIKRGVDTITEVITPDKIPQASSIIGIYIGYK